MAFSIGRKSTTQGAGSDGTDPRQGDGVDGHAAQFELALSYHPPGQPDVLTEKRTLQVSPPARDGGCFIDWLSVFTAGDADCSWNARPSSARRTVLLAAATRGCRFGWRRGTRLAIRG